MITMIMTAIMLKIKFNSYEDVVVMYETTYSIIFVCFVFGNRV